MFLYVITLFGVSGKLQIFPGFLDKLFDSNYKIAILETFC